MLNSTMDDVESVAWAYIPDSLLLHIFSSLPARQLARAQLACTNWCRVGRDEMLWKRLTYKDFHISLSKPRSPGAKSWLEEYDRLQNDVPLVMTESVEAHSHQVLHVAFSHDGSMFSTTSKDGTVIVWNATYPTNIKYKKDMTSLRWKYTQYSQFNSSDTLLLVSGIHFGSPHNTSGEIAVFTVQNEFLLQCRVVNKPYDVFGCWFGEHHLISGELHWLAHLTSLSLLWLNKASQEPESEHIPVITQLYRFYNPSASSVRSVMVAELKCIESTRTQRSEDDDVSSLDENTQSKTASIDELCRVSFTDNGCDKPEQKDGGGEFSDALFIDESDSGSSTLDNDFTHRLLIFTCGKTTFTPHQIGFKSLLGVRFPTQLSPGPPIQERLAARQRARARQRDGHPDDDQPDWGDYDSVRHMFDQPDYIIDLHGHIIGMALSPDHRHLYVNCRAWPPDYEIGNPLSPPPISNQISVHVIDLTDYSMVSDRHWGPRVVSQSTDCYFVFLDVGENLVGSGSEDNGAYIWDRHYGVSLVKLPHTDVVNAIAFNPTDNHTCVTVSDDYSIKIWRSKNLVRKLGLAGRPMSSGFRLHESLPCLSCQL